MGCGLSVYIRYWAGSQECNGESSLPSRNLCSLAEILTMMSEVGLQIPVARCDPGKEDSILYTDNHHTIRTSKPWYSSFLKSKNCLAFFFMQTPSSFPPSHPFQICQPFHWHFRQLLFLHFGAINMWTFLTGKKKHIGCKFIFLLACMCIIIWIYMKMLAS